MVWSQVVYGALALTFFFILLGLLPWRRELGYQPVILPKEPRPLTPAPRWIVPFVAIPIPSRFGAMPTSPVWSPGPPARTAGANLNASAPPDAPAPIHCATIGAAPIPLSTR